MFDMFKTKADGELGKTYEEMEKQYSKLMKELSEFVGDDIKDYNLMENIAEADEGSTHVFTHYMNMMGICNQMTMKYFEAQKQKALALDRIEHKLETLNDRLTIMDSIIRNIEVKK